MLLESIVGATAAAILSGCATAVSWVSSVPPVKDYKDGCQTRAGKWRDNPVNHDLVRGIRTAHLLAISSVRKAHAEIIALGIESGPDDRIFNDNLCSFIDERLQVFREAALDHDVLTAADIERVLTHLIDPRAIAAHEATLQADTGPPFLQAAKKARIDATALALKEIAIGTKTDRVPDLFRNLFEGDPGGRSGWYAAFNLWVSEALKTDPRFRAIFFAAEFVDIKRMLADIDAQIKQALEFPQLQAFRDEVAASNKRIETKLDAIRLAVEIGGQSALNWPRRPAAEIDDFLDERDKRTRQFSFTFAVDALQGREADFEAVEAVLFERPELIRNSVARAFRWHGVHAQAGSGKSRFAMELLERHRLRWPASGFVASFAIKAEHAAKWPVRENEPALLVIDYAGAHPTDVRRFLEAFARRASDGRLASPVRVLLIERNAADPVFTNLMQGHVSDPLKLASPKAPHELGQLTDEQLVALMEDRIGTAPGAPSKHDLIATLRRYDPKPRPLLAAIVADLIKDEALPDLAEGASAEEARLVLFDYLIARERKNWLDRLAPEGVTDEQRNAAQEKLDQHERLVVLATILRGIGTEMLSKFIREGHARFDDQLPHLPIKADEALYRAMIGAGEKDSLFAPLVPDLMGERLVLDLLTVSPESDSREERKDRRDWLLSTTWRLSPWDAAVFARMCFQDYPKTTAALGYLVPSDGGPDRAALSALVRSLIVEMAELGQDEIPTLTALEPLFELHDRFASQLLEAFASDEAVARNVSAILRQLANFAGRAVNRHIERESGEHDPTLEKAKASALARQFGRATQEGDRA